VNQTILFKTALLLQAILLIGGLYSFMGSPGQPPVDLHGMRNRHIKIYNNEGKLSAQGWLVDSIKQGWWHYYPTSGRDSVVYYSQ
jgi:hypothetical protein